MPDPGGGSCMPVVNATKQQDLRESALIDPCLTLEVPDCKVKPSLSGLAKAVWHVLHTRSRQEKAITKALLAAGIEYYLPLTSRGTFRGRRKCVVAEPLFPSYLFMRGTVEDTYFAIATKRVANVIRVNDQLRFASELHHIKCALENRAELSPHKYIEIGRRARVTGGPFIGLEGLVEDHARPDRLVLQVAALGRATSLEIDADLLEQVD